MHLSHFKGADQIDTSGRYVSKTGNINADRESPGFVGPPRITDVQVHSIVVSSLYSTVQNSRPIHDALHTECGPSRIDPGNVGAPLELDLLFTDPPRISHDDNGFEVDRLCFQQTL